jgi:hypothetical protein
VANGELAEASRAVDATVIIYDAKPLPEKP